MVWLREGRGDDIHFDAQWLSGACFQSAVNQPCVITKVVCPTELSTVVTQTPTRLPVTGEG